MATNRDVEPQDLVRIPVFYANSIAVMTSGYDVSILFSREMPGDDGPIKTDQLMIYVSPMLVKRFNNILTTIIARYEESVGVIPLPSEKVEGNQGEPDEDSE